MSKKETGVNLGHFRRGIDDVDNSGGLLILVSEWAGAVGQVQRAVVRGKVSEMRRDEGAKRQRYRRSEGS